MATQSVANNMEAENAGSIGFDSFAGGAAIAAGILAFLYAIAFVVLKEQLLYSICLLLGGLATTVVMVVLYLYFRTLEPGIAQWGLLLGVVAALGSVIHAGYDLGNAINPPAGSGSGDLPSQIDPRGLLTFGITGLVAFGFSWLMFRSDRFPKPLAYLGYLLGILLVIIYLGRLIILDPNNPALLYPAGLAGLIVVPIWYIWIGLTLLRSTRRV